MYNFTHKIISAGGIVGLGLPKVRAPRMDLRNRRRHDTGGFEGFDLPEMDTEVSELNSSVEKLKNIVRHKDSVVKHNEPSVRLAFNSDDWVFTQATAVASVNLKKDPAWQITSDTIKYVNANGNSWSTDLIRQVYKTFIGAMNLKNHIEPKEGGKIYGVIIDAIPRRVKTDNGEYVLYVDCVIATNRNVDRQWAESIEAGKVKYLSVGFVCDFLQCSRCGHFYKIDGTGICEHCMFQLGLKYYTNTGEVSKVSAMASTYNGIGRAYFNELSYLSIDPAFGGATKAYTLSVPRGKDVVVSMSKKALKRPALKFFDKHKQFKVLGVV